MSIYMNFNKYEIKKLITPNMIKTLFAIKSFSTLETQGKENLENKK